METADTQRKHTSVFKTKLYKDSFSGYVEVKLAKEVKHLGHGHLNVRMINSALLTSDKRRSPPDHCAKAALSHCCSGSRKPCSFSDLAEMKFAQQKQCSGSKDECRGECTDFLQTYSH